MFAGDTKVLDLISNGNESSYREEVNQLVDWCNTNNLSLNVDIKKNWYVFVFWMFLIHVYLHFYCGHWAKRK